MINREPSKGKKAVMALSMLPLLVLTFAEQNFAGRFRLRAVQDHFVPHACERSQMLQNGLDAKSLADFITMECSNC